MRKISKTAMIFVVVTMLSLLLVSCKKKVEITVEGTMTVGQEYTLKANQDVTWTSSNTTVLKIEGDKAIPLKAGDVVITAKAGKKTAEQKVTVKAAPAPSTPIVINNDADMKVGQKYALSANQDVEWSVDNAQVAHVIEEAGQKYVEILAAGTFNIIASKGDKNAQLAVTATVATAGFSIDSVSAIMGVGTEYALKADGTELTVTWTSSDPTVLKIEGEKAIPLKEGKVTLTAKAGTEEVSKEITIRLPELTITVEARMVVGNEYTLVANLPVTWTSSNPDVISITNNVAKVLVAGTATITAKYENQEKSQDVTAVKGSGKAYAPKWDPNAIDFNGYGMTIGILVSPVAEYDPFNADFTASGNGKTIKQKHKRLVEQAYGVSIKYFEWADKAAWGPARVAYINQNYLTGDLVSKDNGYILQIATSWIPTLVKSKSVAELYDITADDGYFNSAESLEEPYDAGYIQSESYNFATSVNSKVYGYAPGTARPDYFLYYNIDLVQSIGMEDPAELWFKGEWGISQFEEWVKTAQTNLASSGDKFVLDVGYPEFVIGLVASTGSKIVQLDPANILFTRSSVTSVFDKVQSYYTAGYYNTKHGGNDVAAEFKAGKTIFASGDIWFLKNSDRFDPNVITFKIGCVPYPTKDGQEGVPVNTLDEKEAIKKVNGEPLTDDQGRYISGVDLSASDFMVPFTESSCYAITNVENGQNGLNSEIIFRIFHDLTAGEGPDPDADVTLTADESYRNTLSLKFDYPISVDVVMSTETNMYFEMLPTVSMTVGNGSHWTGNAFWPLVIGICTKSEVTASTKLREVLEEYKGALRQIGYVVA